MSEPIYSVGVDLGTTNSMLAYVELAARRATTQWLEIPQRDGRGNQVMSPILPSFLYRPLPGQEHWLAEEELEKGWMVGQGARELAARLPDRVAHSSKSWLGAHSVDCNQAFLPFGSQALAGEERLSPVDASALILARLRGAWDARFPEAPLREQLVTITAPASFDPVAQQWTLEAAQRAGFPDNTRLLEEPQAAFYRWMERPDGRQTLEALAEEKQRRSLTLLVVDLGGGTSDFSLFEVTIRSGSGAPKSRRIAVSDHFLLGGDNMDLAVAKVVEAQMERSESLDAEQWGGLVATARRVKERALSSAAEGDEALRVAIPSRGAAMFAGVRGAEISASTVQSLILEGFFEPCARDAAPREVDAALREWGLPYAKDPSVLRRLAVFLKERPRVDAMLFNGGVLDSALLRERIVEAVSDWQGAALALPSDEFSDAVARGAARYGRVSQQKTGRIEASAGRGVYLEIERQGVPLGAVCVLPKGTPEETEVVVSPEALALRVNQDVVFRAYTSSRRSRDQAGDIVDLAGSDFVALAPLSTRAQANTAEQETLPVRLCARYNALGRLQIDCESLVGERTRWPLELNLRSEPGAVAREQQGALPPVDGIRLETFEKGLVDFFKAVSRPRDKKTLNSLFKAMEARLGLPKQDWDVPLLRHAWPGMWALRDARALSVEHEEAWLGFSGFLLRPGFGAAGDEGRVEELAQLMDSGLKSPSKRVKLQWFVMWKRLAGGLDEARQQRLFEEAITAAQAGKKLNADAVLLLGALERVGLEDKRRLVEFLSERAREALSQGGSARAYLGALQGTLSRTPIYGGPEKVTPPEMVSETFDRLSAIEWSGPETGEITSVFLRACRLTGNRALDVPERVQKRILQRLRQCGVAPIKLTPLQQVIPIAQSERVAWLGDALPTGLTLS